MVADNLIKFFSIRVIIYLLVFDNLRDLRFLLGVELIDLSSIIRLYFTNDSLIHQERKDLRYFFFDSCFVSIYFRHQQSDDIIDSSRETLFVYF